MVLLECQGGTPEKSNEGEGRLRAQKHRSQVKEVLNQPSGSASALQASGAVGWTASAVQKHAGHSTNTTVV